MRFWWVNQNQTHRFEVRGGYLWSPKTAKGGRRNHFYDTMAELHAGDVVFSYFDTKIQAVGVVQSRAVTAPKPDFGAAGKTWDSVGWLVDVEFVQCPAPFRPKEVISDLIPHLPEKYAPLQKNGNGLQTILRFPRESGHPTCRLDEAAGRMSPWQSQEGSSPSSTRPRRPIE